MADCKPNLFLIGAAKSGTSSLHDYLGRHPEIYMSDPKEPAFFAEGVDYYPSDEAWYLRLFESGADACYRGESSTHYTKLPTISGVAQRIAVYCDSPRFIYLMRDPIDRAISHYWHRVVRGEEFRAPLRAMQECLEYKTIGNYSRQLEPYLKLFPSSRVFTATFEQLVSKPYDVTAEIYTWLGLDPVTGSEEFPAKNVTPRKIERSLLGQRLGEFIYQSRLWDALSPLVPQQLKNLGKRVTTRVVTRTDDDMNAVIEYLRPWAHRVVDDTGSLLGQDFPEWATTLGTRTGD